MAFNFNQVTFGGNLTRDPELRYSQSGNPVLKLGLAVNNRIKKGDAWVDDPCYIDIAVFGKTAEYVAERVSKGQPVLVSGRLQYRTWTADDGSKRAKHEVLADRVIPLTFSKSREPGSDDEPETGDDPLPF
jgi:single-strand DNA-binding protein